MIEIWGTSTIGSVWDSIWFQQFLIKVFWANAFFPSWHSLPDRHFINTTYFCRNKHFLSVYVALSIWSFCHHWDWFWRCGMPAKDFHDLFADKRLKVNEKNRRWRGQKVTNWKAMGTIGDSGKRESKIHLNPAVTVVTHSCCQSGSKKICLICLWANLALKAISLQTLFKKSICQGLIK